MHPSSSLFRSWLPALAFAAGLTAQGLDPLSLPEGDPTIPSRRAARPHADGPIAERILQQGPRGTSEQVLFDQPGDGRIWALGATYKACFGADGFVYVPFLGSAAPRNYPVQFTLRAVRVGGRDLELDAAAAPARRDARVTFDRGAVREVYELTPRGIEQTFVVDGALPGDVDVEMEVTTELTEDAAQAGLQFGNQLGQVDYGTAYLVTGQDKSEIPASLAGRTLRLHVPAARRGAGPVVIDPVIRTVQATQTTMTSEIPDVAYDATTDRWGVAWVHVFSQIDHDVVTELRAGNGDPVAGSFQLVDISFVLHSWPRIANLNSADRFLIAMERYQPANPAGQRYSIWGRTVDAAAPFNMGTLFRISPTSISDQLSVDVGGDPGSGTSWMVVWRHGNDILGRLVSATGILGNTIPIETTVSACISPQISLSNGNGLTATPRWCVVYSLYVSEANWDVFGAVLDLNGVITRPHSLIAATTGNDAYPYVSSPLTDVGNGPLFLVSYERQGTPAELLVTVVDVGLSPIGPEANLTRRFSFTGIYTRVESDGVRFAVTCQAGGRLRAGTLALVNNGLLLHEAPQDLGSGDSPALASKRSGGGPPTDYGIVFDTTNLPARVSLSLYQGRAPAGGFNRRSTACGPSIHFSGHPFLGDVIHFTMSNTGTDLPLLLLGVPMPEVPLCTNCRLGVDPTQPLFVFSPPLSLPLPAEPILVGLTLAVQGAAFGSGSCPGTLRLTDTIDFTIQ